MCQLLDFNVRLAALHKQYRFSRYDDKDQVINEDDGDENGLEGAFDKIELKTILPALQLLPPWRRKGWNLSHFFF